MKEEKLSSTEGEKQIRFSPETKKFCGKTAVLPRRLSLREKIALYSKRPDLDLLDLLPTCKTLEEIASPEVAARYLAFHCGCVSFPQFEIAQEPKGKRLPSVAEKRSFRFCTNYTSEEEKKIEQKMNIEVNETKN
eukprot:snap_masked-scaffold_10-processed-gene-2.19-mRNA-1 protein AED:1.00 eAED:1.00 QI:0/-1/0/0/-1/1/1/0/134